MGYCPLAAWCLPLADLHHLRLTKQFPKIPSAIKPIGTPSAFCMDQIMSFFVVYYLNSCKNCRNGEGGVESREN